MTQKTEDGSSIHKRNLSQIIEGIFAIVQHKLCSSNKENANFSTIEGRGGSNIEPSQRPLDIANPSGQVLTDCLIRILK